MELFDLARYGVLKRNEKILLFEAFSGIGTQAMAFDQLKELIGIDFEVVGFSEIDKYAIKSYHAIHGDHLKNYGDIAKIEQLPKCDVCTWSFPCQDISLAGHQKGMVEGTKSNYGYEFLETVRRSEHKPKILVMENVKALVSERFQDDFKEIQERLKSMGYENHWKVLNAKHYGVAQNRERVFMISILGGGYFQFPPKIKLTKRLKDYLEPVVDEKYYLSEKQLGQIANWKSYQNPLDNILTDDSNSPTITTRVAETDAGGISASMIVYGEPLMNYAPTSREYSDEKWSNISSTLLARDYKDPKVIAIPEATKQGYALAKDGDGVYINRPHQKRGVVQDGMIQTIKTSGDDVGVVIGSNQKNAYIGTTEEPSPALTSAMGMGGGHVPMIANSLRIRKLTPLECWRLMGISDDDFYKAQAVVSNSQLYKQAGNAIVVDVLVAIFKNLIE
jgi:DNA (cytosine-5)-methyltransferase 1